MSQFNPPPPPPPPPPFQPIPPTEPGLLGIPTRGTKWPVIVGVLAMVLGAFNALCNTCPTIWPFVQGALASMMPAGAMDDSKIEERWIPWVVASGGIATLIGILQIVGGAGLMKRAPWSPNTLRTWAVLAIVAGGASTVLNFQMELSKRPTVAVTATASGPVTTMPTTLPANVERALLTVSMGMMFVWICAFPLFVLIWLGRETIREEIRTWQTR